VLVSERLAFQYRHSVVVSPYSPLEELVWRSPVLDQGQPGAGSISITTFPVFIL
jgi:hypothetical protein